jgi:hypothetical protein
MIILTDKALEKNSVLICDFKNISIKPPNYQLNRREGIFLNLTD